MTVIEAEVNRNVTFRVWAINNQAKKSIPVNVAFQTPLAGMMTTCVMPFY